MRLRRKTPREQLQELLLDLAVFLAIALLLLGLAATWLRADDPADRYDPQQRTFTTPLYRLTLDAESHLCQSIEYTVTRAQLSFREQPPRQFWTRPELQPHLLESADYTGSTYDRGHLRALLLSGGDPDWKYANCLAAIVPQTPECNRGAFRLLEQQIAHTVDLLGSADVQILCRYDCPEDCPADPLPQADEPYRIPSAFVVTVTSGPAEWRYHIPNDRRSRRLSEVLQWSTVSR